MPDGGMHDARPSPRAFGTQYFLSWYGLIQYLATTGPPQLK